MGCHRSPAVTAMFRAHTRSVLCTKGILRLWSIFRPDVQLCAAAFRAGAVMGFLLASTGLLVLWLTIHAFWLVRSSTRRCSSLLPDCPSKP